MINCSHPYVKRLNHDTKVCIECGQVINKDRLLGDGSEPSVPLEMPPVIYLMTPDYWEAKNPWPLIPFELAQHFGWYGSVIYGREYLVMPVYREGKAVFYSARCLVEGCPKAYKYNYPEGQSKLSWLSWEIPPTHYPQLPYLVGEGVADAAYLSQLSSSVAILGSYGDLPPGPFLTVMDGDVKGVEAAFRIVQAARLQGNVEAKAVMLPPGHDPTDLLIQSVQQMIWEQTGIKF